jgi:signal transduction histidine kinase
MTALALLWAALVFSRQLRWRNRYMWFVTFPALWSYVAIYRLDNFMLAALPAVVFLSIATLWTGWVFYRYQRQVKSVGAASLAVTLFLWGLHHLDYPFLRARGVWDPWGYYIDILFILAMGTGILLLVVEEQHRGIRTLSALSGDLQVAGIGKGVDGLTNLLQRPLTLAGVRGSAMYLLEDGQARFVGGGGVCSGWPTTQPAGVAAGVIERAVQLRQPQIERGSTWDSTGAPTSFAYAAALPVIQGEAVKGILVMVGDASDPFAVLDSRFLLTLGQQVGAALESAELNRRLEVRTVELERLTARMLEQHEEERRRLARELHDETAQVFSAVKLHLDVLKENAVEENRERLDRVVSLVDEGINSVRNVARDLRPELLDDLGLVPALRAVVAEFCNQTGLTTELSIPDPLPELTEEAELALFRSLQESLSNVARHADATSITVSVRTGDGQISMVVSDNGTGWGGSDFENLEFAGHMGLVGMRERITALHGSVALTDNPDGGLSVRVQLPLAKETRGE